MTPVWSNELKRIAIGTVLALAVGWIAGQVLLALLVATVGYLGFHLIQVKRLEAWLRRRRQQRPPDSVGIWGEIFGELYWLQERTRQRKRRLAGIIDRFKQASEAIPDAAVILQADGRIEWLNEGAEKYLDLRSPQDVGRPVLDLVRSLEFTRFMTAGDFDEALELPSPRDESIILSLQVAPYGDNRRLLLARDISRLYHLERVRRDFVANVSHELRSPLTVIRGYTEAFVDASDELGERWAKPIHQMDQQTNRMCRIVDDLLALSRLESNPLAAGDTLVPVASLLESVREDAFDLTGEELRVSIDVDDSLCIRGEYNELYSAVSNLVFNAVQYTPVFKEIRLRWHADAAGAHLEVHDQGVGIEADHIPRLTERFYRVDKARSRAVGGTGLGLAIVKHVLARHDAQLRIESVVGQGSSFICDFPDDRVSVVDGYSRQSTL